MNKTFALLKALLTEGMNPFRVSGKKQTRFTKIGLPLLVGIMVMFGMGVYGESMMEPLAETGMEYVVLSIFVVFMALFTLMEGIYKSSGLLFNCRDDDLVLALPIKKSTVFLLRMFKLYLFQVMINVLFLAPVMLVYAFRVGAGGAFYLSSVVALLILPILPVVIACIIGGITAFFATKFKLKNLIQISLTTLVLLGVLYVSFNTGNMMAAFAQNAGSINEAILNFYYPAKQYLSLVLNYNIVDLLIFIVTNVGLMILIVWAFGKIYYQINSRARIVKNATKKHQYKIEKHRPTLALIKKEISRFVNSPVFVINAGFGLVLYLVACIVISFNMDGWLSGIAAMEIEGFSANQVMNYVPAAVFGLIIAMSMMTSITSSMISLEGRSFNILKSLPVSPVKIVMGKVLAAMVVMVPLFLIGDLIVFVRFGFDFWQCLMILVASVMMPMIAELIGIIVNLKYPKMDAKDDVEVVKQSMSSMIAVFIGIVVAMVMIYVIIMAFVNGLSASETMIAGLLIGAVVLLALILYLRKRGVEDFNAINV